MKRALPWLLVLAATGLGLPLEAEDFQGSAHAMPYDDDVIGYSTQTPHDRIAKLQAQIDKVKNGAHALVQSLPQIEQKMQDWKYDEPVPASRALTSPLPALL